MTIIQSFLKSTFGVNHFSNRDYILSTIVALSTLLDASFTYIGSGSIDYIIQHERCDQFVFMLQHFGLYGGILFNIIFAILVFCSFIIISNLTSRNNISSNLIIYIVLGFVITRICGGISWFVANDILIYIFYITLFINAIVIIILIILGYITLKYKLYEIQTI